jgi:catechol O-methyltransferase
MPGAPQYLEWVKGSPAQKRAMVEKMYSGPLKPNPNLIYETEVPVFESDWGKVCLEP